LFIAVKLFLICFVMNAYGNILCFDISYRNLITGYAIIRGSAVYVFWLNSD
jgi:hypothetical protein